MRYEFILQSMTAMSPPPQGAPTTGLDQFAPLVFFMGLFAIFYFLIIRPQSKRNKEMRNMQETLKKGDSVITTGGIYGTVYKVKEDSDTVTIEIAEGVRIKAQRHAVSEVINQVGESDKSK